MTEKPFTVVLAGGGTGGHVIPAVALAQILRERGATVRFVGTKGRLEERLVPEAGFNIDYIDVRPLTGKSVMERILGFLSVPPAVIRSALLLKKMDPDVVMGVGGYVAGPAVLGAVMIGVSTAVLEQNATLGLTNRLLARWIDRAFVSYEALMSAFPPDVARVTGNPLKPSIVSASKQKRRRRKGSPVRILVMGGSQGAKAIDEWVPEAMAKGGIADQVRVRHQCGAGRETEVLGAYRQAGIDASVVPFIDDTAEAYLKSDFVVARSGATTVSELCAMGLPAVFLPYPHHADRQQEKNAEPMRRCGAAVVLDEKASSVEEMASAIRELVLDEAKRKAAASAAKALGRIDAATMIADALQTMSERG